MISFLKFTALLALLYGAITLFVFLTQRSFIFYPNSAQHTLTGMHKSRVVEYQLKHDNETLRGWLINPRAIKHNLIIYFGGNAEDVFFNIDDFKELEGVATLLVNYRGYGTSSGTATEKNLFKDALAVYDDIRAKHQPAAIFPMGRSLGSGIATYLASQRPARGVILVTPYDSLTRLARRTFPWLPTSIMLQHNFNSLEYVEKIRAPLLVIYGGRDEVIPKEHTENLLNHIPGAKTVILLDQADHNNISLSPAYWLHVVSFINSPENPLPPETSRALDSY